MSTHRPFRYGVIAALAASVLTTALPVAAHATPTGAGVDCQVFDDPMTCYAGGDHVAGPGTSTTTGPTPFTDCLNSYFDTTNNTIVHDGDIAGVFSGYDANTGFALVNLAGKYNNNACANDLVATAGRWVYWLNNPIVQARNDNGNVRIEIGF